MTKETKNKSRGWLKGVLSNPNENDQHREHAGEQVGREEDEPNNINHPESAEYPNNNNLFSKENQDKISLDLIVALENMLNDRQLILHNKKGLEDKLESANESIHRLKHDLTKKDQLIQDKSEEIHQLETNLTNKQMSYDQLLEDYKDYQYSSKNDYEKLSNQLEKEINKYNRLNEESKNNQYESMLKIKDLEEKVRELEVENEKHEEQFQQLQDEKNELIGTINDFTERMSLSFPKKPSTSHSE
ncbi:coiled-coil domain-containing protein [Evansella halocellulosilytica]|uniref:hypothetical protein n=1 Tax=Evansella halocellulosilytica TaxID=2011013 RepID=UPI000BB6B8C6|nr:hypothetical protein [Evansella halocellulosilytica]